RLRSPTSIPAATGRTRAMTGSLAFDGAVGNAIGSVIRNRSLSRSGGNILRKGDPAQAGPGPIVLRTQRVYGICCSSDIWAGLQRVCFVPTAEVARLEGIPHRAHQT